MYIELLEIVKTAKKKKPSAWRQWYEASSEIAERRHVKNMNSAA